MPAIGIVPVIGCHLPQQACFIILAGIDHFEEYSVTREVVGTNTLLYVRYGIITDERERSAKSRDAIATQIAQTIELSYCGIFEVDTVAMCEAFVDRQPLPLVEPAEEEKMF